jgi:hypothetical protein
MNGGGRDSCRNSERPYSELHPFRVSEMVPFGCPRCLFEMSADDSIVGTVCCAECRQPIPFPPVLVLEGAGGVSVGERMSLPEWAFVAVGGLFVLLAVGLWVASQVTGRPLGQYLSP